MAEKVLLACLASMLEESNLHESTGIAGNPSRMESPSFHLFYALSTATLEKSRYSVFVHGNVPWRRWINCDFYLFPAERSAPPKCMLGIAFFLDTREAGA